MKRREGQRNYSFRDLFRYASRLETLMTIAGVFLSIMVGSAFPLTILVFRLIVNDFMAPDISSMTASIYTTSIWFIVIGVVTSVLAFLQALLIEFPSFVQSRRIRLRFLKALFRQDIAWFDQQAVGDLMSRLSEDTLNIQMGVGCKLGDFAQNMSSFFMGLIIAFFTGWKLTLVACCMLPFILIGFGSFGGLAHYFIRKETVAYSKASAVAEEVLRLVRTVFAFGGEKKELSRYSSHLDDAASVGVKHATWLGFAGGFIGLSVYASAALVFWYGIKLIVSENYDAGTVILVFLNVIIGSMFLGGALPNMRYFFAAKISAKRIFEVIDRVPPIDKDQQGMVPKSFFSEIRFDGVAFAYPTRPSEMILDDFNLTIGENQTVAFVGSSGCGKSTVMHLFQRFFDPIQGKISVDGVDLRELDLHWYRSKVGFVQQEPVLFSGTIAENIRMGKLDATDDEVIEAAKLANAHHFIMKFPEGYSTRLAKDGTGLSVGQKQRLAIARAVVRNPRILILDEATSALDSQSEHLVQTALEKASVGRTVLVIAHRLSTVQSADKIVVMEGGQIRESGTHKELMDQDGLYATLVKTQGQVTVKLEEKTQQTIEDGDMEQFVHDIGIGNGLLAKKKLSLVSDDSGLLKQIPNPSVITRKPSALLRVMKLNRPEAWLLVLGAFSAIITGGIPPMFAILYSEIYGVFQQIRDPERMNERVAYVGGVMVLLGIIRLGGYVSQAYFFGVAGQRLTKRLRSMLFEAILRQDMAWFDRPENQVGTLTVKLASETNQIHPLCGSSMGHIVESTMLSLFSIAIGLYYSWKLTLIVLVFFPVVMISSFLHMRQLSSNSDDASESKAVQTAYESISLNRTLASFGLEAHFYDRYRLALRTEIGPQKRTLALYSVLHALAESFPIGSYAAGFSFGAYLVSKQEIELIGIFRVFAAISFAAQALGRTSRLGPDIKQALRAAARIFRIFDSKPTIVTSAGLRPQFELANAPITFEHLWFRYPSRPAVHVLKDFSHTVLPGQKVAFVGHSGCGKTSIFSILQRFYNPSNRSTESGIRIGDVNLTSLAPEWLRSRMAVVNQEPHLFDISLADNIAYGDNTRNVPLAEIIEAARQARIHDFIAGLPQGYATLAGPNGSGLSGGEKQRIAIARALIRQPALLVLDEATSALDAQTEKEVQASLDEAMVGRTCLISAHRLSAIKHTDLVVVMDNGMKVECGTPSELMEARGVYYALYHAQLLS
ncbi:unnamed protein product [Calicophoron daubneyi]|uniref:Uncharacterized protein n=1 Tax=Calicophoron daubneyi TaxID=300641 RepID=A0AAV2TVW8_CALDB